jgi:2-methylcitrate dehydratase PrpD
MGDYLDHITSYVCDTSFDDLPLEVITRAKEVLADTMAVIAAGSQEDEVKSLIKRLTYPGGPCESTLPGAGIRTEMIKAGLINGTAGTFLELDEGNQFARGHASIHVVPAALAVAERNRLSGKDILTALVLGYEVCARIGIACKLRMSMHPHGTWGTVGAAVAVAKLMGYKQPAMKEIINVSSSLGLATSRRTMLEGGTVRNVYAGVSGYMGILAHDLVQSGFTGEADGLKTIFGSVISETFSPKTMTEALGRRFEITRNYFKLHACCRYNHGSLDALEKIIASKPQGSIRPEEIHSIEVKTYSLAAQLCDKNPANTLAAKFSIPFAIATYIVHGEAGIDSFKAEAVNDPGIKALAQKVTVSEDPALTAMMPDRRPSRVCITFSNGEMIDAETFMNKGDFEDPYGADDLEEKYFRLVDPIWGHKTADRIFSYFMAAEELQDINQATALLAPLK